MAVTVEAEIWRRNSSGRERMQHQLSLGSIGNLCFPSQAWTASPETADPGSLISFSLVIPKYTFITSPILFVTNESLGPAYVPKVLDRGIDTRGGSIGDQLRVCQPQGDFGTI